MPMIVLAKRLAITRALGAANWVESFYEETADLQGSLFERPRASSKRTISIDGMERFVHRRLETIFPYVARPLRLYGPTHAPLYSLFFAVSNPSKAAISVARSIAEHLLKNAE
jgi:hypothetical protein